MPFFGNDQIVTEQIGFKEVQTAATAVGIDAIFINAPAPDGFDAAFTRRFLSTRF